MNARVPAMPPLEQDLREYVRTMPARFIPKSASWAHLAYIYAQALAASDGHRRRVRKGDDGLWHVEHARLGREALQ